ncbi:hypothetical protein BC629DRAFT_1517849 [Irpex lacteus]|nr:hypothetical protein BC629DRAFT_1517849 [Irpex lacteus]
MNQSQQSREDAHSHRLQPTGRRSHENPQAAPPTTSSAYPQSRPYVANAQNPTNLTQTASYPSNSHTHPTTSTISNMQPIVHGHAISQTYSSGGHFAPRAPINMPEQHFAYRTETAAAHNHAPSDTPYPPTRSPYYQQPSMYTSLPTAVGFSTTPGSHPHAYISSTNSSYFQTTSSAINPITPQVLSSSTHVVHQGHTRDSDAGQTAVPDILICDICGATPFKRLHELNRHKASVHQPPGWICNWCARAFTRQDILKKHKRTVHGEA